MIKYAAFGSPAVVLTNQPGDVVIAVVAITVGGYLLALIISWLGLHHAIRLSRSGVRSKKIRTAVRSPTPVSDCTEPVTDRTTR